MGALKNYYLELMCACSEEAFGQDAVEHAIMMGWVTVTGEKDKDLKAIMAEYDSICESYRQDRAGNAQMLEASYAPILLELDTPEGQRKDRLLFPREQEAA